MYTRRNKMLESSGGRKMNVSFAQWQAWSTEQAYTILPYIHTWKPNTLDQPYIKSWLAMWQRQHQYAALLESGKGGRYTILGLNPVEAVYGNTLQGFIKQVENGLTIGEAESYNLEPLPMLRQFMSRYIAPRVHDGPKFIGGIIGYLGYDIIRSIEKLPSWSTADLSIPDYYMLRFNDIWVYDQINQQLYAISHYQLNEHENNESLYCAYEQAQKRTFDMEAEWVNYIEDERVIAVQRAQEAIMKAHMEEQSINIDLEQYEGLEATTDKQQFMQSVNKIKEYIAAGDVFQVNLSQRQRKQTSLEGKQLYEWLRLFNPSPYMSYFSTPELQIVSASPELLVEVRDGVLATRPIAGTRRRGKTVEEEEHFVQELLTNEKEKAEHIMLVDLERNDLGRVSTYGTVKVKELMVIEKYSHVMHLVSQVEGELQQGKDCFDVIAATFPGGTITGAPKIRTMEIIEELEPVRRGIYTGSLGWIDYCGNMELNIVIRTMLLYKGYAYVQAGAGIVIDSNPEREYYESLNKAKALWKALQYAESFHKKYK